MYTREEFENLINNSPLFDIDKDSSPMLYKTEKYNLLTLITDYYRFYIYCNKPLDSYSMTLMETAAECIKYYDREKSQFLSLFNMVMKRKLHIDKAKELIDAYRQGIKLSNYDSRLISKITAYLSIKRDDSSMIEYGLNLLENGLLYGWNSSTLKMFANKANERQLNLIYKANSRLAYDVAQLIKIEYDLLSKSHKAEVDKFNADLQAKRDTIKKIIGDITTKGLRENAKRLKSDSDTRKFSDLCNKLIGHVKADLDKASLTEVERWLKDALELKECALKIQSKLNK